MADTFYFNTANPLGQMVTSTTNIYNQQAYGMNSGTITSNLSNYVGALGLLGGGSFGHGIGGAAQEKKSDTHLLTKWERKFQEKYPPMEVFKGFLHKLQFEIDEWHGDVLERYAEAV